MTHSHHHHDHADWNDRAAWYDSVVDRLEPELGKATAALLDAVALAPGQRLLDLGCGPGHTTAAATARGLDALGIDLSEAMVEAARRRFPASRFAVADMLDPPSGPWDAVVSRLGVHHADPAWAHAARRVLRPGGRVAVAEWGAMSAVAHERGMRDPDHWVALMQDAGFTAVTTTSVPVALSRFATEHTDAPGVGFPDAPVHIIAATR